MTRILALLLPPLLGVGCGDSPAAAPAPLITHHGPAPGPSSSESSKVIVTSTGLGGWAERGFNATTGSSVASSKRSTVTIEPFFRGNVRDAAV